MPNDIYLSSTLSDLLDERKAARDVLGQQGYGIKESYTAHEKDVVSSCLEDVAGCAIYVCIVGMRYGHTPEMPANTARESITQMEFRRAIELNIPCFVFVKADSADYKPAHLDSYTRENDNGERIRAFRAWVESLAGVRPAQFETVQQLREKLLAAILGYEHRKAGGGSPIMDPVPQHLAELIVDVGMVLHPSVDPAVYGPYREVLRDSPGDRRFKLIEMAPDDGQYLCTLDRLARDCRSLCWVVTPAVLRSYQDQPGLLERAVAVQTRRRGRVGLLLAQGATAASLPPVCGFGTTLEADALASVALDDVYRAMRSLVRTIKVDRRIGIPCLVFAMTAAEATRLAGDGAALMAAVADPAERQLREAQLQRMVAAVRHPSLQPTWPAGFYAEERDGWRPFGPSALTAREYLDHAVQRLNDGELSKRERLFIKGSGATQLRMQLLPCSLEEVISDVWGSGDSVLAALDRGCVVLIDEMALLHPALRPWAKRLLKGENVAVLSSHPADPAPFPVSAALAQDSSLQVGSLLTRFRDEQDPRCELAINSPQRLQRWLRLVLPELVPTLGGEEAQQALVRQSDEAIFHKKLSS